RSCASAGSLATEVLLDSPDGVQKTKHSCGRPEFKAMKQSPKHSGRRSILMLLTNCFEPDPRVHAEAKALVEAGYRVSILAWDRDRKRPRNEVIDGIEVERIYVSSTHGRGATQLLVMPRVLMAM